MWTWYDKFRRSALPPSVAAFDGRLDEVKEKLAGISRSIQGHLLDRDASDQAEVLATLRLLQPRRALHHSKRRFGSVGDGGYVMLDDLGGIRRALSFGIDVNDDWDLELAQSGIVVSQYDHSIDDAPSKHENLIFHKKMIDVTDNERSSKLSTLIQTETNDEFILKIDIEGAEWKVFADTSSADLVRCSQICCEFHNLNFLKEHDFLVKAKAVLEKLAMTHSVVHVHANNCAPLYNIANVVVPDVVEVTFAAKSRYVFEVSNELFPTALDAPNLSTVPDIWLGSFQF